MSKSIAIITARGGSKRIPKKNIKNFCGKPIIQYSIEAAIQSGVFSEVMVSTDSKEIAEIAKALGAAIPFLRTVKTSNDYATTSDVLKEVLGAYCDLGQEFDYGCCIYPTAPFITKQLLTEAMIKLKESNADTIIPVVEYSFPPQRALMIKDGFAQMLYPENVNIRSQDLEPIYHDAGQFYAFQIQNFLKSGKLLDGKIYPIIRTNLEVQDIDTEEDWMIAEMKYHLICERKAME